MKKRNVVGMFWRNVYKTSSCWFWTGTLDAHGYGRFGHSSAHEYSWQLANGQTPELGMQFLHSCDTRQCVNPGHLSLGSPADNARDRASKGIMTRRDLLV